jgi:glucose/arabinose dehydrogenase
MVVGNWRTARPQWCLMTDYPTPTRFGRLRLVAAGLAISLLAAACGDQADDAAGGDLDDVAVASTGGAGGDEGSATGGSSGLSLPAAGGDGAGGGAEPGGQAPTGDQPWPEQALSLAPVVSMSQPIALTARPGSDDLWVLERDGRVRLVERTVEGDVEQIRLLTEPVLDIGDKVGTDGEGGLLGLAFSAGGEQLYLHYTDGNGDTVVSELQMGATTADAGSERVLLQVDQPYANHNGGDLKLGPDGLLYIGLGDGGSANDPEGHGQDTTTLLGTLLRLDPTPSGGAQYTIPAGNPFAGDGPERPEIWLWGARNPWRFSFDKTTGDLWIGDVGQGEWEEVDRLPSVAGFDAGRGANLGWDRMEGSHEFEGDNPAGAILPVHEYSHEEGCSITGGYVYRGTSISELQGSYLFADYCAEGLRAIQLDGDAVIDERTWDLPAGGVQSFGQDGDGELFVLLESGPVLKLVPAEAADS